MEPDVSYEDRLLAEEFVKALREEVRPFEIRLFGVQDGRVIVESKAGNAIAGCDVPIELVRSDWDEALHVTVEMIRKRLGDAMEDSRFRF